MSCWPALKQQQMLVGGYCRLNYTQNIPIMLIKMVLSFYNEIFYWTFKDEKLTQFISTPNGERIFNDPFKIKGITFQYSVYPNGDDLLYKGKVGFGLDIIYMNDKIDYIIIKEMFCFDTSDHKRDNILRMVTRKRDKSTNLSTHFLHLSECKNINKITFYAKLEIIRIQPKDILHNKSLFYHKPGIKMSRKPKFEWKFDDDVLEKLKYDYKNPSVVKRYYSPHFDGNNCQMKLSINLNENIKHWFFGFSLYQFPEKIKALKFTYNFKMSCNGSFLFDYQNTKQWNHNNISNNKGRYFSVDDTFVSNMKSLSMSLEMEILKVFDFDDKEIDCSSWKEYKIM